MAIETSSWPQPLVVVQRVWVQHLLCARINWVPWRSSGSPWIELHLPEMHRCNYWCLDLSGLLAAFSPAILQLCYLPAICFGPRSTKHWTQPMLSTAPLCNVKSRGLLWPRLHLAECRLLGQSSRELGHKTLLLGYLVLVFCLMLWHLLPGFPSQLNLLNSTINFCRRSLLIA